MLPTPQHYRLFAASYEKNGILRDLMIGAMSIEEARTKAMIASDGHDLLCVTEFQTMQVLV